MTGASDEATRIRQAAELANAAHARLDDAFIQRDRDREAWDRWQSAASDFHEAWSLLFPDVFWEYLERLRTGDTTAIEPSITFLEVDPWCFRSGYAKESILRSIKRVSLSDDQATRLRRVILNAVDVGDRREFRGYCRLARHVSDVSLRSALVERLDSSDPGRARRALWVLDAIDEPLGLDGRLAARAILEQAATSATWWRVSGWVRPAVRRYGDDAWIETLLSRAVGGGQDAGPALKLLSAVRIDPTEDERATLASLVLRAIETGNDEGWLESTARAADSPSFRGALSEAYASASNPDVRRRAGWAIHAIRRSANDRWQGNPLDAS